MKTKRVGVSSSRRSNEVDDFPGMARAVQLSAAEAKPPFFRTSVDNLFATYLKGFDGAERQNNNCHCCRRFIETYGSLVTIGEDGRTQSVFWSRADKAPLVYQSAAARLCEAVEDAPIEGVFYDSEPTWGFFETFDKKRGVTWSHFNIPSLERFKHPLMSAEQKMAAVREERGMLLRALAEFPATVVDKACLLLADEQLYRGEKVLGVATWLQELHAVGKARRDAKIWRAAALAPPGFCHVRSSMIGTLLEDLASGMDLATVKKRFAEKMNPLQYQRAQTAPTAGNIDQAEKIVENMGIKASLARRYARIDEVEAIWRPRPDRPAGSDTGVFGHLRTNRPSSVQDVVSDGKMTWEKFARKVLPTAEKIEMLVPTYGNYIALVTAVDPTAPPILQWDREDRRNPVSWYVYQGSVTSYQFNLSPGTWCKVTAVTRLPSLWGDSNVTQHGDGAILLLEGARDKRGGGSGFFTEILKSEYHPIRRTLEAYLQSARVLGGEQASACGFDLRKGNKWSAMVRVTAGGIRTQYSLDRWD